MKTQQTGASATLLSTAYHEAGHALADFRLGFKIKHVSVIPDSDSAGRTRSTIGFNLPSLSYGALSAARLARYHERIIALLSGREAQRRFRPQSIRSYMAQSDWESVFELVWRLHPEESEMKAVLKYLQIRTRNLVGQTGNWRRIETLAATLVEKKFLNGEETRRILCQVSRTKSSEKQSGA